MKNILIPIDFSDNAMNAVQYAVSYFKNEACTFHLLNTYTPAIANSRFMATTMNDGINENVAKKKSLEGLRLSVKEIKEYVNNPKHQFKIISSFSLLVNEIKEVLEEDKIDLIVMGTKGASGLQEVFMGTQTVKVIKAIRNCPILVVPESASFLKLEEIAFATDYKKNYDAEMLKPLRDIAFQFHAKVHIVHINEEKVLDTFQEANKNVLNEYLDAVKHRYCWMPSFAKKSDVITQFVEDVAIDLLGMVNFEHSALAQLIREPVIKKMAYHTKIPLLVLPEFGYNELSNQSSSGNAVQSN